MDPNPKLLRHALATLAYRAAKMLRDAPPGFADMRSCPTCRSAGEIVAHLGDLIEWAARAAGGDRSWAEVPPQPWAPSVDRFFAALAALDERLAADQPLECPAQQLFQGPIADALTHVGQLATLRRLAGAPVRGENYFVAEIAVGRVGIDQPPPVREFD